MSDFSDYGKELNEDIKRAKTKTVKAKEALLKAEEELEEARKECGCCNDCSMCLG